MMDENWFAEFNRLYLPLLEHVVRGMEKMAQSLLADLPLGPLGSAFMGKLGQVSFPQGMTLDACYRILGLEPDASWQEVEQRYRELAKRLHPDVAGTGTAYLFQMVTLAYHEIRKHEEGKSHEAW